MAPLFDIQAGCVVDAKVTPHKPSPKEPEQPPPEMKDDGRRKSERLIKDDTALATDVCSCHQKSSMIQRICITTSCMWF
jgi:hypothetical protein